jgi:hypothetical protein
MVHLSIVWSRCVGKETPLYARVYEGARRLRSIHMPVIPATAAGSAVLR